MMQNNDPSEQNPTTSWWKTLGQFLSAPFRVFAGWVSRVLTRNQNPREIPIQPTTNSLFGLTELSTKEVAPTPPTTVETPPVPSPSAPFVAEPTARQLTPELEKTLKDKEKHWGDRLALHEYPDRGAIVVIPNMTHALYILELHAAGELKLGEHQQKALQISFDKLDKGLDLNNQLQKTDITNYTLELSSKIQDCQMYIIQNSLKSVETSPAPTYMPPKPRRGKQS